MRLHRMLNYILAGFLAVAVLIPGVQGQGGGISSGWANRVKAGAAVPASCLTAAGHVFFKTTGTTDQIGLYQCIDNDFEKVGSGGGGSAILAAGVGNTIAAGGTRYAGIGFSTNAANLIDRAVAIPKSGTIQNLFVTTNTQQPVSAAMTITLVVNSVDSTVIATVPISGLAGVYSDIVHTKAVVQGDLIVLRIANPAANTSAIITSITFELGS